MNEDEFIKNNRRLVYKIADRYRGACTATGIDLEDVISEGMIGLILAYRRFEKDRGLKFSTFAYPSIKGKMLRFMMERGYLIRPSRPIYDLVKVIDEANMATGYLPEEIAEHFGCTSNQVTQALKRIHTKVSSLEQTVTESNSGEITLKDMIPDCEDCSQINVNEWLSRLDERQRRIVNLYVDGYSQEEIAKEIGISQAQVSRHLGKVRKSAMSFFGEGVAGEN